MTLWLIRSLGPTKVMFLPVPTGDSINNGNILGYIRILSEVPNLPVIINGQTYYRTAEVCLIVGIGKTTLFRWIKEGIMKEAEHRDRRGWRLFTEYEIDMLKAEVNGIRKTNIAQASTQY